jgi:hypothetical protein
MKAKHNGITGKGTQKACSEAPVPGCRDYEERLKLWNSGVRDATTMATRLAEVRGPGPRPRETKESPVCLTLHLNHGDILIMHGAGLQKYYEV